VLDDDLVRRRCCDKVRGELAKAGLIFAAKDNGPRAGRDPLANGFASGMDGIGKLQPGRKVIADDDVVAKGVRSGGGFC